MDYSILHPVLQVTATATPEPPLWVAQMGRTVLSAFLLTIPITWMALRQYQRALGVQMARTAAVPLTPHHGSKVRPTRQLELVVESSATEVESPLYSAMAIASRRSVLIYLGAGVLYGLAVAVLWLGRDPETAFTIRRFVVLTVSYAGFALPTIIIVAVVQKRLLFAVPIGYLALVGVVSIWGSGDWIALQFVALMLGIPFLLASGVASRAGRAIRPALFAALATGLFVAGMTLQTALRLLGTTAAESGWGWAAVLLLEVGVGILLASVALPLLVHLYRTKRVAEQELRISTWWLLLTCTLVFALAPLWQDSAAFLLLLWPLFWVTTRVGFARTILSKPNPPAVLLLLRVFSERTRTERLMRDIEIYWRYVGPVELIAGPDLATSYLEPHELLDFARGRVASLFQESEQDVARAIEEADHEPDPDGRYRVNEFFCTAGIWQHAVRQLIPRSDAILADFRAFKAENAGAAYEMGLLLDLAPLDRLVCLVDGGTDRQALGSVVMEHWQQLSERSPNRRLERPQLTLLEVQGEESREVRKVVSELALAASG